MPTADLDAVCALLPGWAVAGAWLATPLLGALLAVVVIWLAARCTRTPVAGLHWTEVARRHFGGSALVGAVVLVLVAGSAIVTYSLSGALTEPHRLARALLTALLVWLASRPIACRRAQRVRPWLTVREYVRGYAMGVLVILPLPLVAIAMGLVGPATYAGREWQFAAVYGGGLLTMLWLLRGGGLALGRALGLIVPAPPALRTLVADVERRTGHTVASTWLARMPMANAAALPRLNSLLVTARALEVLDEAELTAILLHEFGHLRESAGDRRRRAMGATPVFVLAFAQPIGHWLGPLGLLLLILFAFAVAVRARRASRRLEAAADAHALEHQRGDEEGVYARSLERLYRDNVVPAVMRGTRRAHPDLYDRMTAAGVTPDYERPLPPHRHTGLAVLFAVLAGALLLGQRSAARAIGEHVYDRPFDAHLALVLTGGSLPSLAALGYHWQESRPADAITLLAFASAESDWPDYPARLAILLADRDPTAANACLQRAEALCADLIEVPDWLREEIDVARQRLGLPPRNG